MPSTSVPLNVLFNRNLPGKLIKNNYKNVWLFNDNRKIISWSEGIQNKTFSNWFTKTVSSSNILIFSSFSFVTVNVLYKISHILCIWSPRPGKISVFWNNESPSFHEKVRLPLGVLHFHGHQNTKESPIRTNQDIVPLQPALY